MNIALNEMMETITMVQMENLEFEPLRWELISVTCADSDFKKMNHRVYEKITTMQKI